MPTTHMTSDEFKALLSRHNLSLADACHLVYLITGSVIPPSHVRSYLDRQGRLSKNATGLWRLFFQQLEKSHDNREV